MDSPRSEQFDDIYFAVEDGLEETKHVFLAGNNLPARWEGRPRFTIAETGFGTGLNFLSVWKCFEENSAPHQTLTYISFEKYPLSAADISRYLGIWSSEIGSYLSRLVAVYPLRVGGWHKIKVTDRVTLLLVFDDVNRAIAELDTDINAWFLDGHAPAKNPDMWSQTVFDAMARTSCNGTTCATFTAAGVAKRGLRGAGFAIEKRRGFGRKRDMIVGVFSGRNARPAKATVKNVAVVGGGLAGTSAGYALSRTGCAVDIYESAGLGAGASGNPRGLFNPRFSAQRSAESDFYASAYALAVGTFRDLQSRTDIGYHPCGSLHLAMDEDKTRRFDGVCKTWDWHHDHLQKCDTVLASEIAGISISKDSYYLPDSAIVDPYRLCRAYAAGLIVHKEDVALLERQDSGWRVNGRVYDAVVIATGAQALSYSQTSWLPLNTVRGQLSFAASTPATLRIKANLCYGGYCSVGHEGRHVIGSTFQPWLTDTGLRDEDHQQILSQLEEAIPALRGEFKMNGGRAALRTASKDRVPVGGAIPDAAIWSPERPAGLDGLYISTGHGSHGLLSSLLIAEQIAASIQGTVSPSPASVLSHLSPERFLQRSYRKS